MDWSGKTIPGMITCPPLVVLTKSYASPFSSMSVHAYSTPCSSKKRRARRASGNHDAPYTTIRSDAWLISDDPVPKIFRQNSKGVSAEGLIPGYHKEIGFQQSFCRTGANV